MYPVFRILILFFVAMAFSSDVSAFFWSSQETQTPAPHYFYHQRLLHSPNAYNTGAGSEQQPIQVPVPSIPVQVPIKAQLTPAAALQNVQLVPCLCPVSQDFDFDKNQQAQETVYFAPNIPNNINNKNS